jgi:hypothetical protein
MDASIYRIKYRDVLTLCVISLLCLGVIMVQSTSSLAASTMRAWGVGVYGRIQPFGSAESPRSYA